MFLCFMQNKYGYLKAPEKGFLEGREWGGGGGGVGCS